LAVRQWRAGTPADPTPKCEQGIRRSVGLDSSASRAGGARQAPYPTRAIAAGRAPARIVLSLVFVVMLMSVTVLLTVPAT